MRKCVCIKIECNRWLDAGEKQALKCANVRCFIDQAPQLIEALDHAATLFLQ